MVKFAEYANKTFTKLHKKRKAKEKSHEIIDFPTNGQLYWKYDLAAISLKQK